MYDGTWNPIYCPAQVYFLCSGTPQKTSTALPTSPRHSSPWSNCIKPSNATCLAAKVKPKAMKALGKPYDELSAIAMKCRKNNAGQSGMYEKCANNVYKKALAYVYKAYVDQACLKLSTAINVAEYNCCRKMVDLVVKKDVSGKYSCYSKAKPKAGTTPTCPK